MITKYEKANKGKLLVAVLALAVVLAGVAVVFSDSEVNAASADETNISGSLPGGEQVYDDGAIVNVVGNLTIKAGESLTIGEYGTLKVEAGNTLTVNGTLTISANARVIIDGSIVVSGQNGESGPAKMAVDTVPSDDSTGYDNASTFEEGIVVNGTISVERGASINTGSALQLNSGSNLKVSSLGVMVSTIQGTVNVAPGATLTLNGAVINNQTLTINADDGAEVKTNADARNATVKITNTAANTTGMTVSTVSNLTFTATKETDTAYKSTTRYSVTEFNLDIAGTLQNGDKLTASGEAATTDYKVSSTSTESVTFKNKVVVSGTLTVRNATFEIADNGYVLVSGTSNFIKTTGADSTTTVESFSFGVSTSATIEISGTTTMDYASYYTAGKNQDAATAGGYGNIIINGGSATITNIGTSGVPSLKSITGVYYTVPTSTGADLVVCGLEPAINAATENSDITTIYAFNVKATESFEIPAGLTVYAIGVTIPENVTVTINAEAYVQILNKPLTVEGKLIDNTYSLVASDSQVVCEVIIDDRENAVKTFTSLSIAISEANEGDVITLAGKATISENLTIPAGITVELGDYGMEVTESATLTVNGVLDASGTGELTTTYDSNKKTPTGTVVVNNYMIVADGTAAYDEESFNVSGVYTQAEIENVEGDYFIMSLAVFADNSAYTSEATAQGVIKTTENITLTAGDNSAGDNTLAISGNVSVGTITIVGYAVTVDEDGLFNGTISATNGSVTLENIRADSSNEVSITNVVDSDEGTDVLAVSGKPVSIDKDGTTPADAKDNIAKIAVASGTVAVTEAFDTTGLVSFGISEGTTLDVSKDLTVSKFEIAGTVNVLNGGEVSGATIIVTGTLNVTDVDATNTTGGSVAASENMYVGTDDEFKTSSAATVSGNGITVTGTLYVAATATMTGDAVEGAKTQFYVEDALWLTAYGTTATVNNAPLENARFLGWIVPDTTPEQVVGLTGSITIADYERLDAKVDYKIYDVTVTVGDGIGSVAIDGQVLAKNYNNTYVIEGLTAGQHEVTFQFKTGYEGTVTMTVDGTAASGYNFTLSGTEGLDANNNVSVAISLAGATPIDYTQATSDDGMGIVEILLVILVVVVVILAIIVVLRMMRS